MFRAIAEGACECGDRGEIQRAETAYLQALQWVYDVAVGAVSA